LYGSLTLREEHSPRIFESRVMVIFGPKRNEIIGWRKLHIEEFHNLYSAKCNSNDQVKEDEIDRACSTHGRRVRRGFWWEIQKERCHQKDLDIGGRIILKWISDK
jgi:hypothetical protein